jgi:hypothetical protein
MYELYDPCTVMFFYRNKHIMIDLGTGNNNKINWAMDDKQEMIDTIEVCIFNCKSQCCELDLLMAYDLLNRSFTAAQEKVVVWWYLKKTTLRNTNTKTLKIVIKLTINCTKKK